MPRTGGSNYSGQAAPPHRNIQLPLMSKIIQVIPEKNESLKIKWKEVVYSNIYSFSHLKKTQEQVLGVLQFHEIPVVVLKGTSAAKYYPKPQLRTMGDIDLLVKPNDYKFAAECLLNAGCIEKTTDAELGFGRHRSFLYNDTIIELHVFFSFLSDKEKSDTLDKLLYDAICDNQNLPDDENGLVLLAHIGRHLEYGLGLRQIIDWMMFVRAYLDDEKWGSSFQYKAQITGLESLAIIVTKMCQIYLGLPTENITWCKNADEAVCNGLMQYVMECGNFGRSRELLESGSISKTPSIIHPIQLFKHIQSHGEKNWKALKRHPWLKPFAWVYQSCRYVKFAFQNNVTPNKLKAIYDEGNKRNEMFVALGLK